MEIFTLLETLEDLLERSRNLPFSSKSVVDKDEILDLIKEIRLKLPDELKQAKWIKEERQRILQEAQTEADTLIKNAEDQIIAMVNENEITKKAIVQGNQIIENARSNAQQITDSSYNYADNLLETVEKVVMSSMKDLEQCVSIVRNNRSEMRNNGAIAAQNITGEAPPQAIE